MQIHFGGVYQISGNSLDNGFDPDIVRAMDRIKETAQKKKIPVEDIRMRRAGASVQGEPGYVYKEVRAVFTAEDAIKAKPLIGQIQEMLPRFRKAELNTAEVTAYRDWWHQLRKILGQPGVLPVNEVNRLLTRHQFNVVSGAPSVKEVALTVYDPQRARLGQGKRRQQLPEPPAHEPSLLNRLKSWLKERFGKNA